jgi:ketosteroid isomerase-like protein
VSTPVGSAESAEVVRGVYASFRSGDLPAVLAAMAADMEWREAESNPYQPNGSAWIGPDAVQQNLFRNVMKDWARFIVIAEQFHEAGDTIVVEGRYVANHNATGLKLDCQFCHVWKVRDGKLRSFQQYVDTAKFRQVMGAP